MNNEITACLCVCGVCSDAWLSDAATKYIYEQNSDND